MTPIKRLRYRYLSLFCICLATQTSIAQTQQQRNDSVFEVIKHYINQHNGDAIYDMANDKFQAAMTRPMVKGYLQTYMFPLDSIMESRFINYSSPVSSYRLIFATDSLDIQLATDSTNKLSGFTFRPHVPDKVFKVPTSNPLITAIDNRIDTIAREYINKINTVGMCIGIYKDGKFTCYGYGETAKGNRMIPGDSSIFQIGSITKTFTATILAYFVSQRRVMLTDPITKFLPDSIAANKELAGITLQMLSNHTSGLPRLPDNLFQKAGDAANPYKDYDKKMLFDYLKDCKLKNPPGTAFEYSNLAAGLLGVILEHVSEKSFEEMVTHIICLPLNMNSTAQDLNIEQQEHFVSGYNEHGNPTPSWDFDALAAAGSLRSSVHDLLLFEEANMKTSFGNLSKAMNLTHKITWQKETTICLGWMHDTLGSKVYYWHDGGTSSSSSYIAFSADKRYGVVILSNAAAPVEKTGKDVLIAIQQ